MDKTYGFSVNKRTPDESYIEVVKYENGYVTIGDGANQFAMSLDEWEEFKSKFNAIKAFLDN